MGVTDRQIRQTRRGHPEPRLALGLLGAAIIGVAAIVGTPLIKRAIRHFTLPLKYASIIRQQATEKRLDPALIAAVIYAETRFSPRTSPTGAEGLMQIEPATAIFLAHRSGATSFTVADLGTPQVNIAYGSYYLRYLLDEYGGSKVLALAAYNAGETNVDKWIALARGRHVNVTITSIPLAIRPYVNEVLSKERSYRANYATELGYRP
jgi:soluble lytic murein transglycosylase